MAILKQWNLQDSGADAVIAAAVGTTGTLFGNSGITTADAAGVGPGGLYPNAIYFNGVDRYIDIPDSVFASGDAWSVNYWYLSSNTLSPQRHIGDASSNNHRIGVINDGGGPHINISVRLAGTNVSFPTVAMTGGLWHHILVTHSTNGNLRLFANSIESSTGAIFDAEVFSPRLIGQGNNIQFVTGAMAGIKIFDSDESDNVTTLFNEGSGSPTSPRNIQIKLVGDGNLAGPGVLIGRGTLV